MVYRTTSWKQTEIGKVPSDWDVKTLGELGQFASGYGFPEIEQGGTSGVTFFKVSDMNLPGNEISMNSANNYVTAEQINRLKFKPIKYPSIVFAKVGAAIFLERKKLANNFLIDNNMMAFTPNESIGYIKCVFNTIKLSSYTKVGALPSYNAPDLKPISIRWPPDAPEQTAIAEVLSDLDGLIYGLEKLRDKKRAIKTGTMQRLLSGLHRLSGFNKPWIEIKLGDENFAQILKGSGLSKEKLSSTGKNDCILYGELFTTYDEQIINIVSKTDCQEGVLSKYGDILLPGSTTTKGVDLADASAVLFDNVLLGGDINIIRDKGNNFNPVFMAYLLNSVMREEIGKISKGSTVYHLHGKDLATLTVKMPSMSEQTTIANILSDMDAEIDIITNKINKYRAIKDGVAAELLSGRIRLVKPKAEV